MKNTLKLTKEIIVLLVLIFATGCSSKGWVFKDRKTNNGIYSYKDGSSYNGSFDKRTISGPGTFFYNFINYKSGSYIVYSTFPKVLIKSNFSGIFENGHLKNNSFIIFNYLGGKDFSGGFTYEGYYSNGGFQGHGLLTFNDGRTIEGDFSNEETLYANSYCCVYYELKTEWDTNNFIGSKITGQCKMTWPNGTVFDGKVYDYYFFDRGNTFFNYSFVQSFFHGIGVLKVPGNKDYNGLVGESADRKNVYPISNSELISYVTNLKSFPSEVAKARNQIDGWEAKAETEGKQAQKEASDWMRNEMANLPKKLDDQLAEYDAGSRGTTVEAEKEKARKKAEFDAIVAKNNAESEISNNSNSSNSSNDEKSNSGAKAVNSSSENNSKNESDKSPKLYTRYQSIQQIARGKGVTKDAACEETRKEFEKMKIDLVNGGEKFKKQEGVKSISENEFLNVSEYKCQDLTAWNSKTKDYLCEITFTWKSSYQSPVQEPSNDKKNNDNTPATVISK